MLDRARGREAKGTRLERILQQIAHLRDLAVGGGGRVIRATLSHHVEAQRRVRYLRADIDCLRRCAERVHVFREGFPVELDAFGQRRAGDVLDTFHEIDQVRGCTGAHGGEADPAVAEDHRGDTMPGGGRHEGIPGGLAVVVGVYIDETRRY